MVNQNSLRVDALDKGRKHTSLGIRASSRDQDVVGMPVDRQNGRPERLLEMLGDPPVVLFIEGTDSDCPRQVDYQTFSGGSCDRDVCSRLTWLRYQQQTCLR